jgi:hypothetical protein
MLQSTGVQIQGVFREHQAGGVLQVESQLSSASLQMVAPGRARVSLTAPMRLLAAGRLATPAAAPAEGSPAPSPLAPREQDFLYLDVRALSAVLIQGYWLDHSDETVMKAAVPLLARMPVLLNHSGDVRQIVGVVAKTWWGEDEGFDAPGIDATLRLDSAVCPLGIIRGLLADPPLNLAVSVSWWGEVAQSHPDMSDADFWTNLGREVDGQVVRLIVTRIDEMPEISLVWAGADPQARPLTLTYEPQEGRSPMTMPSKPENPQGILTVALAALAPLGKSLGLTDEQMAGPDQLLAGLCSAVDARLAKIAELEPLAEAGRAHLEAVRKEALRLAAAGAKDHKVPEHLTKLIGGADLATAQALIEQFGGQAATAFTARCQKCGTEVPIRSSLEAPDNSGAGPAALEHKIPIYG